VSAAIEAPSILTSHNRTWDDLCRKPNTEEGVGWLETWQLGQLRNRYFFSYKDLNQAILEILAELDVRPYQKRAGSRLSVFLKIDLPVMRPLPAQRFEYPEFKLVTVGSNYHIK
jgi:hypothetical protein